MELETFKEKLKFKEENLFASMDDPLSENVYAFDISSDINFSDVNTMFTKDHKTISWIRNFKKNSIFFDIGAGVGINSIFAGIHSKAKVYSFEPEASNYNSLVKNEGYDGSGERLGKVISQSKLDSTLISSFPKKIVENTKELYRLKKYFNKQKNIFKTIIKNIIYLMPKSYQKPIITKLIKARFLLTNFLKVF